jgi:hypothetical protein
MEEIHVQALQEGPVDDEENEPFDGYKHFLGSSCPRCKWFATVKVPRLALISLT